MSIFESIKSEKTLTFSHWRYRLLHWFFNVNPANVEEAVDKYQINHALYTHYCPLFHITNLLAIGLPFIILFRVLVSLLRVIGKGFSLIRPYLPKPKVDPLSKRQKDIKRVVARYNRGCNNWKDLWYGLYGEIDLTEAEVEDLWNKLEANRVKNAEAKQERLNRHRSKIVFWVNFSQVFLKLFFNIAYISVILFVLYLVIMYGSAFVGFLLSFSVVDFMLGILYSFLWAGLAVASLTFLYLAVGKTLFPVIGSIFGGAYNWVNGVVVSATEFVSIFYTENCPPVKIVSDEEMIIEEGS